MPIVYSDSVITSNTMKQQRYNTSSQTKGLVITNYSNYVMNIGIVSDAVSSIIPPYSQIKIPIASNTSWSIIAATLSAAAVIPNITMYVDFNESSIPIEPGIISLAQLPAYNMNVSGSFNLTGTNNNVNIGTMPAVTINGTTNVNIANTPSMNIASGSVNATIQNASIKSDITNALIGTGPATNGFNDIVVNLAVGGSMLVGITLTPSFYDSLAIGIYSPGAKLAGATLTLSQIRYDSTGGANYYNVSIPFDKSGITSDGPTQSIRFNPVSFTDKSYVANAFILQFVNGSGSAINETMRFSYSAKYSTTQAQQAIPNYSAAVTLNPTASGNVPTSVMGIPSPPGIIHRYIISIRNNGSIVLPANAYIYFMAAGLPSKLYALFNVGGLAVGAAMNTTVIELSPGVANVGLDVQGGFFSTGTVDIYVYAVQ